MGKSPLPAIAVLLCGCTMNTEMMMSEAPPATRTVVSLAPVSGGTAGATPFEQVPMTISELVECINLRLTVEKSELRDRSSSIDLSTRRSALESDSQALETQRLLVDARDASSVANFNGSVNAVKFRQDSYNRDVGIHNARIDFTLMTVQSFNAKCAGRSYVAEDLRRIDGGEDSALLQMLFPAGF